MRLRLRPPRGARIVAVEVFVNGRRVLRRQGRNLRRVSFREPHSDTFKVKVVERTNKGRLLTTRRRYRACTKGGPHTIVN